MACASKNASTSGPPRLYFTQRQRNDADERYEVRKQTFSWEILAAAAHDRLPGLVGGVGSATPGGGRMTQLGAQIDFETTRRGESSRVGCRLTGSWPSRLPLGNHSASRMSALGSI